MYDFVSFRLLVSIVVLLLPSVTFAVSKPPNVVVLYADDWRFDTLGCAGNPIVKTPNLDALAARGMRFTHNCVTTSICGVSRASLYTGQWMSRHGNTGFKAFATPWADTYPGLLRANGYHVGHVGKWHNGDFPAQKYDFGRAYSGVHWVKQADGSKIHVTQKNENDALEFLNSCPRDKPFCLTLAFFATHAEDHNPKQFLPQEKSMALYKDVKIPVPVNATEESWKRLPEFFTKKNEGRNRWGWRFDTPEKYQEMMKNYYRLVTEVDATCGRVIEELKKRNLYDDTLVIFTTDNGYFHAEHGLGDKWYPHQESIRVPLIIDDPRMPKEMRGKIDDHITLNVDLAPTILAYVGIKAPPTMQGRDMSVLYTQQNPVRWREDFFYEHATLNNKMFIPASEALVTKEWKYFYWPDFGREQLFHLANDPREEKDLANDAAYGQQLATMKKRFLLLKKQSE